MKISFKIDCASNKGEKMIVIGSAKELGNWNLSKGLLLNQVNKHEWEGSFELNIDQIVIQYKYAKIKDTNTIIEGGENRTLQIEHTNYEEIRFRDFWRPSQKDDIVWRTKAFKNILSRRVDLLTQPTHKKSNQTLRLQVNGTSSNPAYDIGIIVDSAQLGEWEKNKYIPLSNIYFPTWHIDIDTSKINFPFKYKYVLVNRKTKKISKEEEGEKRMILDSECWKNKNYLKVHSDDKVRAGDGTSRIAGISLGIWQIRGENTNGVGDFISLKNIIKWCHNTGQRIIHLLPINDIEGIPRSERIYPFETRSAYALNPLLLNIKSLGKINNEDVRNEYNTKIVKYESADFIEFEEVLKLKTLYARTKFDEDKDEFLNSEEVEIFRNENKTWLYPYAVFNFNTKNGKTTEKFSMKKVHKLFAEKNKNSDELTFTIYLQFHLHKQLKEVVQYARNYGIILDIEIPTTIHTKGVESWQHKNLFNANNPIGVPPNRGEQIDTVRDVASCNWNEMIKSGFNWWKNIFTYYGKYFDACRLSDIETIFRTWHIPQGVLQSRLGYYKPSNALKIDDLIENEFWYDESMSKPFIKEYFLSELFGENTEEVKIEFFDEIEQGHYQFKDKFATQQKTQNYFRPNDKSQELTTEDSRLLFGLQSLHREILFIRDESNNKLVHPRVNFQETYAFINLSEDQRRKMEEICSSYFTSRHEEVWHNQANTILTELSSHSTMLLSVDDVSLHIKGRKNLFSEMGILSEKVQRISYEHQYEFIRTNEVPYLSILYSSRPKGKGIYDWWMEKPIDAVRYVNHIFDSNKASTTTLNRKMMYEIIINHWKSTSMAVVLTIHDLMLLSDETHKPKGDVLQLRMKQNTKELLNNEILNRWISENIKECKRSM